MVNNNNFETWNNKYITDLNTLKAEFFQKRRVYYNEELNLSDVGFIGLDKLKTGFELTNVKFNSYMVFDLDIVNSFIPQKYLPELIMTPLQLSTWLTFWDSDMYGILDEYQYRVIKQQNNAVSKYYEVYPHMKKYIINYSVLTIEHFYKPIIDPIDVN